LLIFDIETGPLPDDELRALLPPFDESQFLVGDFDERSVKLGNMKDPAKIKAKIDAARDEHESRKANLEATLAEEREKHWQAFKNDAALSAVTGKVIVVSYCNSEGEVVIDGDGEEREILTRWWDHYRTCRAAQRTMVGLNIFNFDLPFLVRRSWILDVSVPGQAFTWWKNKLNWNELFLDVRTQWLLGEYGNQTKSNFDTLAQAFGTGGKPDGITGADFARLWQEDREKAIDYATQDVVQPVKWLEKMQLLQPATAAAKTEVPVAEPKPKRKAMVI
jgi:hypothetical protein